MHFWYPIHCHSGPEVVAIVRIILFWILFKLGLRKRKANKKAIRLFYRIKYNVIRLRDLQKIIQPILLLMRVLQLGKFRLYSLTTGLPTINKSSNRLNNNKTNQILYHWYCPCLKLKVMFIRFLTITLVSKTHSFPRKRYTQAPKLMENTILLREQSMRDSSIAPATFVAMEYCTTPMVRFAIQVVG